MSTIRYGKGRTIRQVLRRLDLFAGDKIIQVLPLLHDNQVEVRHYLEDPQHLIQHLPVWPRHAYDRFKLLWILLELLNQWAHLDGLQAGSENEQDYYINAYYQLNGNTTVLNPLPYGRPACSRP